MKTDDFNKNLIDFISKGTCSFTCIQNIKKILKKHHFEELNETDNWNNVPSKFFITRNDASIIAIELPKSKSDIFSIITSHSDSPALLLKPDGNYIKENYLKYNIMPYGGLLNYGWLDHALSLAGRIILEEDNMLKTKIIDFNEPILVVPSVAIHQKTDSNTDLDLNMHIDMQPIISLTKNRDVWNKILRNKIKNKIVDYDLFAYNPTKPIIIGEDKELLVSPRIDNLTSVFAALLSFLNSNSSSIKVFCAFNNEEIGSLTEEGADSNFLLDILKRVASIIKIDIASALSKSFIISSDNTHAIHPNHTEYADDTGVAYLGDGFTIVREINSTTNAISSGIIKKICNKHNIKYQNSTAKNDIASGSTLSGISLRHVSVLSIDVGICELSMHSSIETCALSDIHELYKMMLAFYSTKIERKKDTIFIS